MLLYIIGGIALAVVGFFVGYFLHKTRQQSKIANAETNAEKIITDAKAKQTEILLHAQEKALATIKEAKVEEDSEVQAPVPAATEEPSDDEVAPAAEPEADNEVVEGGDTPEGEETEVAETDGEEAPASPEAPEVADAVQAPEDDEEEKEEE